MNKEFFQAIRSGDRERVNTLLASDATLLHATDDQGLSAFVTAKYTGQNEIAAMLLSKGIDLDIFGASMAGDAVRVTELARSNRDLVNSYSSDGWTPLHLACFFSQRDIAEALIGCGAEVNARSRNAMQNTPLHAAAARRNAESVRLLIEHGADVNARQEGGWTALHAACLNGDSETMLLLMAGGADVQARANNNQNAMDLALTKGHQAVVDVLDQYAARGQGAS